MAFTLGADGPHRGGARFVDRFVRHGAPMDARDLFGRVITDQTRYLLLDLDRTLYFGRNIGELLGWEVCAQRTYGDALRTRLEARRAPGRFLLDAAHPLAALRYLARGAATWAYPGLYYLLWGKIVPALRPLAGYRYLRFGEFPHRVVQQTPSLALMHDLAGFELSTLLELTRTIMTRHHRDQVIAPSDIAWLKARFPRLRIVLTSASPQPVVQAVAEAYGIEAYEHSCLDVADARMTAPHRLHPLFFAPRCPERLGRPGQLSINSGTEKIARLVRRYPDLLDGETVGVTDTSHEEDHPWMANLTRVVDINSPTPFPVLVGEGAAVTEVHSAQLRTLAERAGGQDDARRGQLPFASEDASELARGDLEAGYGAAREAAGTLVREYVRAATRLEPEREAFEARRSSLTGRAEVIVDAYNSAVGAARHRARSQLQDVLREESSLLEEQVRLRRPLARLRYRLDRLAANNRLALREPLVA